MSNHGVIAQHDDGTESLQVSDATIKLLDMTGQISKEELELVQIQRYQSICEALSSPYSFRIIKQRDRPDFFVERGGKEMGIDVAAFAFNERRRSAAQFWDIKNALRDAYRAGRLRKCRGVEIVLAFADRIPTAANARIPIAELVDAFETLEVDWEARAKLDGPAWVMGKVENPFPIGQSGSTSDGSIRWYVSGLGSAKNVFSTECGFNIELQYLATATKNEVKDVLDGIVAKHDKPGQNIDELVIVAGGPDRFGEGTIDESMLATFFVEHWRGEINNPANVKEVILMNWARGTITALYPASN
jgi:hypothetical protein